MPDYEKLGVFYLGKEYDLPTQQLRDDLLLYDSKDLVTHAVCVGMKGSGKTGLCLALLEEAAIDGVPAILIDPTGDLANLLLTFLHYGMLNNPYVLVKGSVPGQSNDWSGSVRQCGWESMCPASRQSSTRASRANRGEEQ